MTMPIRMKRNSLYVAGEGYFTVPCGLSVYPWGIRLKHRDEYRYVRRSTNRRWVAVICEAIAELAEMRENLLIRRQLKEPTGDGHPGAYGEYTSPNGVRLSPRALSPFDGTVTYHRTYGEALRHRLVMERQYIETYKFRGIDSEVE